MPARSRQSVEEVAAEARRTAAWREASDGLLRGKPLTEREIAEARARFEAARREFRAKAARRAAR